MPTNNATGIFGFPVPEKIAKAVEDAHAALPKDVREHFKSSITDAAGKSHQVDGYCRRVLSTKAADFIDGERADISVVTSDAVDRDGEVVAPEGLDWSQFLKSPAVALSHNYTIPRVGKCLWIKRDTLSTGGSAWKAKTAYTPRPADFPADQEWIPETAWFYVREGCLPAKSIGFIPMSFRDISPDDLRANPDLADARWIIDKALVLEYSVCMLGTNPDALVDATSKMRAKGIACKSLTDALGVIIPDDMPATEAVVQKNTAPVVAAPATIDPKTVKAFVSQRTIDQCAERRVKDQTNIHRQFEDGLMDRVYRAMGKV